MIIQKLTLNLVCCNHSTDDISSTLAGRDATRLQPSGAYAANLLGLSYTGAYESCFSNGWSHADGPDWSTPDYSETHHSP